MNLENNNQEYWTPGYKIKGRYEIKGMRKGGLANVYICFDHEFHSLTAIKTFQERFAKNRNVIARFKHEAELWMRLEKHTNIVWAKWVDTINQRTCIFMEYIPGDTVYGADLYEWISNGTLIPLQSVALGIQICTGMIYAQRKFANMGQSFVHRDLKPSNIMVDQSGTAKVTDFGLAKAFDNLFYEESTHSESPTNLSQNSLTRIGDIFGTPAYMAPEQWLSSRDLDFRADIYSFGCILYEMLAGRPPFLFRKLDDFKKGHLELVPETLDGRIKDMPGNLGPIAMKCLRKDPDDRYQSFEELRNDLNRIFSNLYGHPLEFSDSGEELSIADLSNIAMSLHELGKSKEALEYYDRLLSRFADELSPEMVARSLNNRANCHSSMGNDDKALMNYELAWRIDPAYDYPLVNAASILLNRGEFERALGQCDKAIQINPNYEFFHISRAEALSRLGRYEEAVEACTTAIKLNPTSYWAYRRRGEAYAALRNHSRAQADYLRSESLKIV